MVGEGVGRWEGGGAGVMVEGERTLHVITAAL